MQPTAARRHALPALLAIAAAALAGCDVRRPFGAFEAVRDHACVCKDLTCAEAAEARLVFTLEKEPRPANTSIHMARQPIIDQTRRCLTTAWRASQPPELFTAEAEHQIRRPGPCEVFFDVAREVLACDRTPLAVRTRAAADVISLRTNWDANGTMLRRELELYDMCLAALSSTMGVERCQD